MKKRKKKIMNINYII
ncbi:hypothetical protein Mgra_00001056, partial [Meloidogyne graminicola]